MVHFDTYFTLTGCLFQDIIVQKKLFSTQRHSRITQVEKLYITDVISKVAVYIYI